MAQEPTLSSPISLPIMDLISTNREGDMDHIIDVMASHGHLCIMVETCAERWMGSRGCLTTGCDLLIRNKAVESIALDLVKTGRWKLCDPDADPCPPQLGWDIVLETKDDGYENESQYLTLWLEKTYHIIVDECPTIEVPDFYAWQEMLIEER